MNIPKKIRIGSCDYDVLLTERDLVANQKESYATIDYSNHEIEINTKLGDSQLNELSFLHEMFHGIIEERSLAVQDEELIVEGLAKGLHQIIRDNPNIFKEGE